MSIFMCSQGHTFRSQFAADNCGRCRNKGRPKSRPEFKLDRVGKLLIRAAGIAEGQQGDEYELREPGGNMHPVRALYLASNYTTGDDFGAAVRRLFDCCGCDFMDHDQVENVCDLVAAAFWEVTCSNE